jgi:hypothetical protein
MEDLAGQVIAEAVRLASQAGLSLWIILTIVLGAAVLMVVGRRAGPWLASRPPPPVVPDATTDYSRPPDGHPGWPQAPPAHDEPAHRGP